jgi:hypothetical protein
MFIKSKQFKGMPQTLQINRKVMIVIEFVFKDDYFSNLPSYNSKINQPLSVNVYAIIIVLCIS